MLNFKDIKVLFLDFPHTNNYDYVSKLKRLLPVIFIICCQVCSTNILLAEPIASDPETIHDNDIPAPGSALPLPKPTPAFSCEYNRLEAYYQTGTYRLDRDGISYRYNKGDYQPPVCIISMLQSAFNECSERYEDWDVSSLEVDNCIAWQVFGLKGAGSTRDYGDRREWVDKVYYIGGDILKKGVTRLTSAFLYIKVTGNDSCEAVSEPPAGAQVCYAGVFDWYSSPISLLLDDNLDIDSDIQIVQFPLDPFKGQDQWTLWKASNKAPLLVHDPEHTGKITTAFQLFGDWTFGGKPQAKANLSSKSDLPEIPTPWENGYQALATLDKNNDKLISDEELKPLALWFDNNRNGVSEPGEVRKLGDLGIQALFYQPNSDPTPTGSLFAEVGYLRSLNGKMHVGRSVDWRADTADSREELLNKHLAAGLACPKTTLSEQPQEIEQGLLSPAKFSLNSDKENQGTEIRPEQFPAINDFSGFWRWRNIENLSTRAMPEGFLGFKVSSDGKISGHAYNMFGVKNPQAGFSDIFTASKIVGNIIDSKSEKIRFRFRVLSDPLNVVESEAEYDPQKQEITGRTYVKTSIDAKAVDLTYSWAATTSSRL